MMNACRLHLEALPYLRIYKTPSVIKTRARQNIESCGLEKNKENPLLIFAVAGAATGAIEGTAAHTAMAFSRLMPAPVK